MRRLSLFVVVMILCCAIARAQDVRAISGGTKTEPDPKDKKSLLLIAEISTLKLTLGKSHLWKHKRAQIISIYLKIENLSDSPIHIQTSRFSAIDANSKGYAGLETEEAIKRFNDTHGVATAIIAGPFMNPAIQAKTAEAIRRESLQSGDVPPHSYKEGMIFFEGPKEQRYTLKINLSELWPEPFVFSTEKQKN